MKYPNKIRICGKDYKVKYIKQPMLNKEKSQATIDYRRGVISVKKGWWNDYTTETLIHECLHGISDSFCIHIEEKDIEILAPAICALFKNNPILLKMLGGENEIIKTKTRKKK